MALWKLLYHETDLKGVLVAELRGGVPEHHQPLRLHLHRVVDRQGLLLGDGGGEGVELASVWMLRVPWSGKREVESVGKHGIMHGVR